MNEARFGRFTVKPGEIIELPGLPLKVYGINYGFSWPEVSFTIAGFSPVRFSSQGAGEVDFISLEGYRSRFKIGGNYEGLQIFVREIERDLVIVEISPYESKSFANLTSSFSTFELNVGDRLLVPGGYVSARSVDHQRGTFYLEYRPDEGQGASTLNHIGEKAVNRYVSSVEFGVVQFVENGICLEARLVGE